MKSLSQIGFLLLGCFPAVELTFVEKPQLKLLLILKSYPCLISERFKCTVEYRTISESENI